MVYCSSRPTLHDIPNALPALIVAIIYQSRLAIALSGHGVTSGENRWMQARALDSVLNLNHGKLLHQCLMPVRQPNVGYVGLHVHCQQRASQNQNHLTLLMSLPAAPGKYHC